MAMEEERDYKAILLAVGVGQQEAVDRYRERLREAEQELGREYAIHPGGDHSERLGAVRVADAAYKAALEQHQLIAGYIAGQYVVRPSPVSWWLPSLSGQPWQLNEGNQTEYHDFIA